MILQVRTTRLQLTPLPLTFGDHFQNRWKTTNLESLNRKIDSETDISPENGWLEYLPFRLGLAMVGRFSRGENVSFRECTCFFRFEFDSQKLTSAAPVFSFSTSSAFFKACHAVVRNWWWYCWMVISRRSSLRSTLRRAYWPLVSLNKALLKPLQYFWGGYVREGGWLTSHERYNLYFDRCYSPAKRTWLAGKIPWFPWKSKTIKIIVPWNCWWSKSLLKFHGLFGSKPFKK